MGGMRSVADGVYIGLAVAGWLAVIIGGPAILIGDAVRGDFTPTIVTAVGVVLFVAGYLNVVRKTKAD